MTKPWIKNNPQCTRIACLSIPRSQLEPMAVMAPLQKVDVSSEADIEFDIAKIGLPAVTVSSLCPVV